MTSQARDEVEATLRQFFRAMDTQDYDLMMQLLPESPTMVHVGTDRDEIWRGYEHMRRDTRRQFATLESYKADIYDLTVHFSDDRQIAWYMHRLDAEIRSESGLTRWDGARFTGVLKKMDGQWKMMQTHVSVPESA